MSFLFQSNVSYPKLKTNLSLAVTRLKRLQSKRTELNRRASEEVAEYLAAGKTTRAKVRVEHVIREDYLIEAMELTELFCDMIVTRFGIIEQKKDLDEGLSEPISSILWVSHHLQAYVAEMKVISEQLGRKYGKEYVRSCEMGQVESISERLRHKMSIEKLADTLIENYLVEIAKTYNVEYEPDPQVMDNLTGRNSLFESELKHQPNALEPNQSGGLGFDLPSVPGSKPPLPPDQPGFPGGPSAPGGPGGASWMPPYGGAPGLPPYGGAPGQPPYPGGAPGQPPFPGGAPGQPPFPGAAGGGWQNNLGDWESPPPYESYVDNTVPGGKASNVGFPPDVSASNLKDVDPPKPDAPSKLDFNIPDLPNIPNLPDVPGSNSVNPNDTTDDIDFDDLTKRFNQLKKK